MKNEGTSGQTKRTEFTRPLSLWESKMEKNPQSLTLCHGQTSGLTELNSQDLFLWGSKRIQYGSKPLKII